MKSSNRIVLAEKVLHELRKRTRVQPSQRGRGFDVMEYPSDPDRLDLNAKIEDAGVITRKWFPTEDEAHGWLEYRRAEAIVLALDAFPASVEEFATRFEDEYFQNYETDEASDEGKQLAKAILKPFVKWFEDGADKRKSTPSGMTLAMARMFGFLTYTVNAATIPRESGARLEKLRELLIDIGQAATGYQAEDDRESMVVDDLLTGEREGVDGEAPAQSIELTDETPTEGNA